MELLIHDNSYPSIFRWNIELIKMVDELLELGSFWEGNHCWIIFIPTSFIFDIHRSWSNDRFILGQIVTVKSRSYSNLGTLINYSFSWHIDRTYPIMIWEVLPTTQRVHMILLLSFYIAPLLHYFVKLFALGSDHSLSLFYMFFIWLYFLTLQWWEDYNCIVLKILHHIFRLRNKTDK